MKINTNQYTYKLGFFDFSEGVEKTIQKLNNNYMSVDVLFFTGNWEKNIEDISNVRLAINCNNIFFLYGDEDLLVRENITLPYTFWNFSSEIIKGGVIVDKGLSVTTTNTGFNVEIKDLFNQCKDMFFLELPHTNAVVSYYPLLNWKGKNENTINIYSKGNSKDKLSLKIKGIKDYKEIINER